MLGETGPYAISTPQDQINHVATCQKKIASDLLNDPCSQIPQSGHSKGRNRELKNSLSTQSSPGVDAKMLLSPAHLPCLPTK